MDHPYSESQTALIGRLAKEAGIASVGFIGTADESLIHFLVQETTHTVHVFDYSDRWGAGMRFGWDSDEVEPPQRNVPAWFKGRVVLVVEGMSEVDLLIHETASLLDPDKLNVEIQGFRQARTVFFPEKWMPVERLPFAYEWELLPEGTVGRLSPNVRLMRDAAAEREAWERAQHRV